MRKIFNIPILKVDQILFADTDPEDYSMSRVILTDVIDNEYIVIEGSHCSCYGFEDCEWGAMSYTEEELVTLAKAETSSFEVALKDFIISYFASASY